MTQVFTAQPRLVLCLLWLCCSLLSCSPKPLKVGVALPLSGGSTHRGQEILNAILLAVEEVNQAGGIQERPLQLQIEDDRDLPEQAKTVAQKLSESEVLGVIGHYSSDATLAAVPIYAAAELSVISPSVTLVNIPFEGRYFFRTIGNNSHQAQRIQQFLQAADYRQVAIIQNHSKYAQGLASQISRLKTPLQKLSILDDTDQGFTQLQRLMPELVIYAGGYQNAALFLQRLREQGLEMDFMGDTTLHEADFIRRTGLKDASQTWVVSSYRSTPEFEARYRQRFGEPGPFAWPAYQAAQELFTSFQKVDTLNRKTIQAELQSRSRLLQKKYGGADYFQLMQIDEQGQFQTIPEISRYFGASGRSLGARSSQVLQQAQKPGLQASKSPAAD